MYRYTYIDSDREFTVLHSIHSLAIGIHLKMYGKFQIKSIEVKFEDKFIKML
jgi:hypothetical protein